MLIKVTCDSWQTSPTLKPFTGFQSNLINFARSHRYTLQQQSTYLEPNVYKKPHVLTLDALHFFTGHKQFHLPIYLQNNI